MSFRFEEWRPISGFPGYEISSYGHVRSWRNKAGNFNGSSHPLRQDFSRTYGQVALCCCGTVKRITTHRLVAGAFCDREPGQNEVNHIDGNKTNNNATNLEWCTRSENHKHAFRIGLRLRNMARLSEQQVEDIRAMLSHGMTHSRIAEVFSVHRSTVTMINRNKTWNHPRLELKDLGGQP